MSDLIAIELGDEFTPNPDLARTLRKRVLDLEIASIEAYGQIGRDLRNAAANHFIALGALVIKGWSELRPSMDVEAFFPDSGEWTITTWERYSARLWGCSPKSVTKAREVAMAHAVAEIPADVSDTLVYEVTAGLREGENLDDVLEVVVEKGYTTWQVRLLKKLRKRGLVEGWVLPRIVRRGDRLVVSLDRGGEETIARFTTNLSDLARAGRYLLSLGVKVETNGENKNRMDK